MKLSLLSGIAGLCIAWLSAGSAGAVPYVYTDPIDSIVALGTGLPSEDAEKDYLADYLGLTVTQVDAVYVYSKDEDIGVYDHKDLSFGFDPEFSWDYAIVKVDGPTDHWYLFVDDNATQSVANGDDILTTPSYGTEPYNMGNPPKGISHVSWFKTTSQVPEPASLILLGLGLLGLGAAARKKMAK